MKWLLLGLFFFVSASFGATLFPKQPTLDGRPALYKSFALPITPYSAFNPNYAIQSRSSISAPYEGYPSFAADLYSVGDGTFYAISDRGPFTACGPNAEFFPLNQLAPTAIRFRLNWTEPTWTGDITVHNPQSYYWLRVSDGNYLYNTAQGLSPQVTYFTDATCQTQVNQLQFVGKYPGDGLDPGAFGVLKKSQTYLIGEGNLPSLVVTDSTGKFRQRFVPSYAPLEDSKTSSPVTRSLPGVLGRIRSTRDIAGGSGFGGLVIDQKEEKAWVVLRRPLGSDDAGSTTRNSNLHRVISVDVRDPLNLAVTGMYYYQTTPLSTWQKKDANTTAQHIRVTAMARLTDSLFLVLERGRSNSLIYAVDFSKASNVINDPESLYIPTLFNEERSHRGEAIPWTLPTKTLVLDLSESGVDPSTAAEGLLVLSDSVVAITAHNGWVSSPFKIHAIQLGKTLPSREAKVDPTTRYFETGGAAGGVSSSSSTVDSSSSTTISSSSAASSSSQPQQIPHTYTLNFNLGGLVQN